MKRYESSVTSISWIPSEAVEGMTKVPFEMGVAHHYDAPLPDVLEDFDALCRSDAFRFANELRGRVEVDGGNIVGYGQSGQGHIGSTTVLLDGVLVVEVDDLPIAEVGPGAILGERAVLEGGRRTSTLRAVTPSKVAVAGADEIDGVALADVAEGHRREEARP